MAEAGYGCEFGDCMKQFRYMITDITNGATITLCEEHYGPGLIPLLAAELGVDPGDFYSNVERYLKRQAAKADKDLADVQAAKAVKGSKVPASSPEGDGGEPMGYDDDELAELNPPAGSAGSVA